jgi:long-chain fatty acid transport protein
MKKILGILAGAALVTATPAHATNGMRMIGFGPVQNGMGGAGAAAPSDSSAVVSNPAGLSGVAPRVDLAVQAFMPTVKYTATYTPNGTNLFQAGQTSDRPTDWLPTLGAVFRVTPDLTLGVAALGTNGMGVDYEAGASGLYGAKTKSSYLNGRLAPAAAYRLGDLSVGVALNLMYAQMGFDVFNPAFGGSAHFASASSLGYGATVGVTFTPVKELTVGASYETKSSFQDFEFTVGGQKLKLGFDQPQSATVGIAVRPVEWLLLAVDGQWIDWSDIMGKNLPKFTSPAGAGGFNMNWDDQLVLKAGVEWKCRLHDPLKLRLGYDYGKSPVDPASAYEAILFPAIAEHHFTVGAGYELGKVTVNAAFVYSPEKKITGQNPNQGIVAYETKMSQTAFELGASYRF